MNVLLGAIWVVYGVGLLFTWLMAEWHMVSPPNPPTGRITRTWFVAGYDKWIGLFQQEGTESKGYCDKKAYWFPIPCVGVRFERRADGQ